MIKTKSLDRRTICARAHVRPRGAVNFKSSQFGGLLGCAHAQRQAMPIGCVYLRWIMALPSPTQKYCDNVSFSSEKSSEEDEEEEKEDKKGEKKYIVGGA